MSRAIFYYITFANMYITHSSNENILDFGKLLLKKHMLLNNSFHCILQAGFSF